MRLTFCPSSMFALVPSLLLLTSILPGQVVITEIMYHPSQEHGENAEFLELSNIGSHEQDLASWCFRGITFCFPQGSSLAPGSFLVIGADGHDFSAAYGGTLDFQFSGKISDGGETLQLLDAQGHIADEVTYSDRSPWPVKPDGLGPSLEIIDPAQDNDTPRNWRASVAAAGHTAGSASSVGASGLPAWISDVSYTVSPSPGQPILVTAKAIDANNVNLLYRIDFQNEKALLMVDNGLSGDAVAGDEFYSASIPGQTAGRLVRLRIGAGGIHGNMVYPRLDDTIVYVGTTVSDPGLSTQLPLLEWFILPRDYEEAIDHAFSDETEPAVLAFQGRVWDSVSIRVRGGSARWWPKLHWKFVMPQGHDFEAEDLLDRPVDRFNLQGSYADKTYLREKLGYECLAESGVPSNQTFHARIHQNGSFYGLYVFLEQPDDDWIDRHGLDENAARYKAYSTLEAVASEEELHWGYEKESREQEDYSDLFDFVQGINQREPAARRAFLLDHVDIPAVMSYLAVQTIIQNNDQVAKNYYLYRDSEGSGRWTMHPWDLDLTFGRNYLGAPLDDWGDVLNDVMWADVDRIPERPRVSPSHPLFGDQQHQKWDYLWNRLNDAIFQEPDLRAIYFRRLRTLMDLLLVPGRFESRIAELVGLIGPEAEADRFRWGQYGTPQSLPEAIDDLVHGYLIPRRTHLFETHCVPGEIPDAQSQAPAIRISEIMFQPPGGSKHEYVEFFNPSWAESVDVSGWTIDGLGSKFPQGSVILPRQFALLVRSNTSFRQQYGGGRYVLAEYQESLSDAGHTLIVADTEGREVDRATYGSGGVWPQSSAGGGASLERISLTANATSAPDWAAITGGSPAGSDLPEYAQGHLLFPILEASKGAYTGYAVSNLSRDRSLELDFTARSVDGQAVTDPMHPSRRSVQPGQQLAELSTELVGSAGTAVPAWLEATSNLADTGSFFQAGGPNFLDGGSMEPGTSGELFFSRVGNPDMIYRGQHASIELAVGNPTGSATSLLLEYFDGLSSTPAASLTRSLPAYGLLRGAPEELVGVSNSFLSGYIRVRAIEGPPQLAGVALIWFGDRETLAGLNALRRAASSTLYSAQLAAGATVFTEIKLINPTDSPRTIVVTPVSEGGEDFGRTFTRTLFPGQEMTVEAARDLGLGSSGPTQAGSARIEMDRPGVIGDVLFGDPARLDYAAALPLTGEGMRELVFSQVANLGNLFTGLAFFNPNHEEITIGISVFSATGEESGSGSIRLEAGSREARLLSELIPETAAQVRGYIWITSTGPVLAQELFGSYDGSFLSAVPPGRIR